jgi:hypothetical protein
MCPAEPRGIGNHLRATGIDGLPCAGRGVRSARHAGAATESGTERDRWLWCDPQKPTGVLDNKIGLGNDRKYKKPIAAVKPRSS